MMMGKQQDVKMLTKEYKISPPNFTKSVLNCKICIQTGPLKALNQISTLNNSSLLENILSPPFPIGYVKH